MLRLVRGSVIASAALLAGCASWMPSWDLGGSRGADVSLTIESDPAGADARTSMGPGCRTPCMIPVTVDREFTVTYTLSGYLQQSIAVRPRERSTFEFGPTEVTPNPVFAQLDRAPPPVPPKRRPGKKKAAKGPPAAVITDGRHIQAGHLRPQMVMTAVMGCDQQQCSTEAVCSGPQWLP